MGKAKRTLSVIMAALMLVFTCMTYVPASAAEVTANAPEVAFVGVDHSPLVVGDTETFSLTTANADKVQYNVVLNDATGKLVEDLTKGYSAETAGNVPFEVKAATVFAAGKYSLVVNAKRVSDGKIATYTAALNCVSKDDANRVYANGAMVTDKDSYVIGDKITVTGINGLAGIPGPYKYRLHVFNATTGTWTKNVVASYGDKIEWTPSAPGTYVLDVHVNTEKSTTWAKYLANPTSTDVYGTYEAWKLKTVVVEDSLKVTDVKAPNQKTIKVTFNKDLGTVYPINFSIAEKDDQYSLINVESVSVSKNVATITTYDALSDGTSYVLTTTNVPSADGKLKLATATNEFKYTDITSAASIAFKATKYAENDEIGLVIKDKDGNDITPNFDLASILEVEISDEDVVSYNTNDGVLTAETTGKAIVNVKIADTDVETGNTIITVGDTLQTAASIGAVDIASTNAGIDLTDSPSTTMYENNEGYVIDFQVLDENGEDVIATPDSTITKEVKSLTPSVLVIDTNTRVLTPVDTGSAQVLLKATFKGKTVSKVVTVTVKAAAEPTTLKVDNTSLKVVGGSAIPQTATVTLYDQYGKAMDIAADEISYTVTGDATAAARIVIPANGTIVDGAYEVTATPTADKTVTSSRTVKVTYDNGDVTLKTSFTVSLVKPGTFAGYAAVADATKLDMYADNDNEDPSEATITIYEKDVNGNYTGIADPAIVELTASNTKVNTATSPALTVSAHAVGTSTVTVKIGNDVNASLVKVGTISFTVVDTQPEATTYTQSKATVKLAHGDDIFDALFVNDGHAFSAKDQYGDTVTFDSVNDYSVVDMYSTDSSVVNLVGTRLEVVGASGDTAKVVVVADKVYEITIVVE